MVIIILGSKSDLNWGEEIAKNLKELEIPSHIHIASAHKSPEFLLQLLKKYESYKKPIVYICVAGRSNALGGFVDAQTKYSVINCPPQSSQYGGMDILSSLRMPSGVAPLTVLEPEQAALAAGKILGYDDRKIQNRIVDYHKKVKNKIQQDDRDLRKDD